MELEIILPAVSDDAVSAMLRIITSAIQEKDATRVAHGFLGGSDGYGGNWNSPVFEMRPFYWGDCDCGYEARETAWAAANSHSEDCYQSDLKRAKLAAGAKETEYGYLNWPQGWSYDRGRKIEERIYDDLGAKHGKDPRFGAAIHCTCQYQRDWEAWIAVNGHTNLCTPELPNFLHRASGMEVRWYKYIGRSMEVKGAPVDLTPVLRDCLADIAEGLTATTTIPGEE